MVRTTFSSREVISALTSHGFVPVGGKGSHTTLRCENPDTGEVRTILVDGVIDETAVGTVVVAQLAVQFLIVIAIIAYYGRDTLARGAVPGGLMSEGRNNDHEHRDSNCGHYICFEIPAL